MNISIFKNKYDRTFNANLFYNDVYIFWDDSDIGIKIYRFCFLKGLNVNKRNGILDNYNYKLRFNTIEEVDLFKDILNEVYEQKYEYIDRDYVKSFFKVN